MKLVARIRDKHGEIAHDPKVGFYLYIFEDGRCIRDHLQDTVEQAMRQAAVDYGIPQGAWRETQR